MKKYKIIYTLCFLFMFGSITALADRIVSSEQNPAYTDHFGIINALYSKESRLVISDMSLHYTHGSGFYKKSGARVSSIVNTLKPGTPVKFHFFKKKSGLLLKDLKIISMREFEQSEKSGNELF